MNITTNSTGDREAHLKLGRLDNQRFHSAARQDPLRNLTGTCVLSLQVFILSASRWLHAYGFPSGGEVITTFVEIQTCTTKKG